MHSYMITKETNLGEIAAKYPKAAEYLMEEWNLHCIGCFANVLDTLEAGMKLHGYKNEDIVVAIREINALLGSAYED